MTHGLLTDRGELEALFDELAQELAQLGTTVEIVMVGGSWMLWHSHELQPATSTQPAASQSISAKP